MTFVRYFIYIVCGALVSSALGGLFACAVALISPEFVASLFGRTVDGSLVRYAAGDGMIWGLFMGNGRDGLFVVARHAGPHRAVIHKKAGKANW